MKKQPENEKKFLTVDDLPGEPDKNQPLVNFFKKDLSDSPIKKIWADPAGRVVLSTVGVVGLLYGTGFLFRVLAYVRRGINEFKDAGRGPNGGPPKS